MSDEAIDKDVEMIKAIIAAGNQSDHENMKAKLRGRNWRETTPVEKDELLRLIALQLGYIE